MNKRRRSFNERISNIWERRKWYVITYFPMLFGTMLLGRAFPAIEGAMAIIGYVGIFFYLAMILSAFFQKQS